MDGSQEKRARKLVEQLESAGMNCGLLAVQRTVVMRCAGADYTDTPTMFDESDLQNAIALDLLEKHKVSGSFEWEWYVAKEKSKRIPKPGDWIIFSDGSRRKIDGVEKGVAFYGKGDYDLVPFENLVPAHSGEPNCWDVDNTR